MKKEELKPNQRQILEWLRLEQVAIRQIGKDIAVTQFGLNFKKITKNTFNAILPFLKEISDDRFIKTFILNNHENNKM